MANGKKNWVKLAGFMVTVLVLLGTIGASYWDHKGDVRVLTSTVEASDLLRKTELDAANKLGCHPSAKNTESISQIKTDIAVTKQSVGNIKEDVAELRTEQRQNTKTILEAIKDGQK